MNRKDIAINIQGMTGEPLEIIYHFVRAFVEIIQSECLYQGTSIRIYNFGSFSRIKRNLAGGRYYVTFRWSTKLKEAISQGETYIDQFTSNHLITLLSQEINIDEFRCRKLLSCFIQLIIIVLSVERKPFPIKYLGTLEVKYTRDKQVFNPADRTQRIIENHYKLHLRASTSTKASCTIIDKYNSLK